MTTLPRGALGLRQSIAPVAAPPSPAPAPPRPSLCARVRSFCSYAIMTTGRRALTLLDVATDLRTFSIFYGDRRLAYTSSFLLASIGAPFLVFWVSSHNFAEALRAQRTYAVHPPRTCGERWHRRFHNLMSIPLLGTVLTALQVLRWWLWDMVTGLACQHWHRQEVEVLRTRDFRRSHLRRMPRLMPPDAARFFSYVEVFYEALPQTLLQLFVFLTGISDHFTGRDVLLSVGASLANVVLSLFEIERTARSLGIPAFDYMLFFISGSVGDILAEGIPLRRFLRNPSYDEADFSGFQTLYADPRALHAFETIFHEAATPPPGTPATPSSSWWRTVILPRPHGDEEGWCYARFRETARMLVAGRMNPHIHLTTVSGVVPAHALRRDGPAGSIVAPSVQLECIASSRRRTDGRRVRAARGLNRRCGICGTRPGDFICSTWGRTLDDEITRDGNDDDGDGGCCCSCSCRRPGCIRLDLLFRRAARRERVAPNHALRRLVAYLWPLLSSPATRAHVRITTELVDTMFAYLLVGDLGLLGALREGMSRGGFRSALLDDLCDIVGPDVRPELPVSPEAVDSLFHVVIL